MATSRAILDGQRTAAMGCAWPATAWTWVYRSPNGASSRPACAFCPWFQRHGATIPSLLDQAPGVLLAGLMVIILAGGEGALTMGRDYEE